MIIGSKFDGDKNTELMMAQHDVYGNSLDIMVKEIYIIYRNSREVLKDFTTDSLLGALDDLTYDHRCLQNSHDHLAAYWRKAFDYSSPHLPFKPMSDFVTDWQDWLRDEVRGWFYRNPTAITGLRTVLTSQSFGNTIANMAEMEFEHKLALMYPLSD